jgi:hypothetical protein
VSRQYVRSRGVTMPVVRRMTDLRRVGLSFAAIKAVVELDHGGVHLTENAVRHYLRSYAPEVRIGRGRGPRVAHDNGKLHRELAGRALAGSTGEGEG